MHDWRYLSGEATRAWTSKVSSFQAAREGAPDEQDGRAASRFGGTPSEETVPDLGRIGCHGQERQDGALQMGLVIVRWGVECSLSWGQGFAPSCRTGRYGLKPRLSASAFGGSPGLDQDRLAAAACFSCGLRRAGHTAMCMLQVLLWSVSGRNRGAMTMSSPWQHVRIGVGNRPSVQDAATTSKSVASTGRL
jgi:hypothetical protein